MASSSSDGSTPGGLLLVISGPSGVGKTTITRELQRRFDAVFSVSATTRPKAPSEVEGVDYFFIDEARFDRDVEAGRFLEHARVFGRHCYGTPREPVERHLHEGRLVMLDIDVQGALQVRQAMPSAFMVFILPPSESELLRRLRDRGRDDEEAIQRRFAEAKREIETARVSSAYDEFVVNDHLDRAVERVVALVEERRAKG
ncbi:MAG: guanylate kinase [Phycisphaerales bacterium]|nr:guanylate kinase [Phycisphaerales bacterium]